MAAKYSVNLSLVAKELDLRIAYKATNFDTCIVEKDDINRPALQLTGFYEYFDPERIQIIGRVESTYLKFLEPAARLHAIERLFQHSVKAIVCAHGVGVGPDILKLAEKYDTTVFTTDEDTSDFQARIIECLRNHFAPRCTIHGVLVEIHGEGVLITGDSGIGKSETALELIKRGHRLIADDAVDICIRGKNSLIGSAPELIRYYMELRGIGVVNVRHIYGVGAVKSETEIQMVVSLEPWIDGKFYDRMGLSSETETLLGIEVPKLTIPVRPGRNLAVIMELAAMNNRQKRMGFNAAETLAASIDNAVDNGLF